MSFKFIHNPNCSKSRQALEYLNNSELSFEIVEYLNNPLTSEEINRIINLGTYKLNDFIREKELTEVEENWQKLDDRQLSILLAKNPKALQRPILYNELDRVVIIARPPELILKFIENY